MIRNRREKRRDLRKAKMEKREKEKITERRREGKSRKLMERKEK